MAKFVDYAFLRRNMLMNFQLLVYFYRALKQAGLIPLKAAQMSQRIGFVCRLYISDLYPEEVEWQNCK